MHVSARTGEGLDALRRHLVDTLSSVRDEDVEAQRDRPGITNVRHAELVRRAHAALIHARDAARSGRDALPEEFLLADLQQARAALEEIAGRRAPDEVLEHIFARFCVGK